ncbi:hypothetical protein ABKN59_011563 [Abortiporus biennis]
MSLMALFKFSSPLLLAPTSSVGTTGTSTTNPFGLYQSKVDLYLAGSSDLVEFEYWVTVYVGGLYQVYFELHVLVMTAAVLEHGPQIVTIVKVSIIFDLISSSLHGILIFSRLETLRGVQLPSNKLISNSYVLVNNRNNNRVRVKRSDHILSVASCDDGREIALQ